MFVGLSPTALSNAPGQPAASITSLAIEEFSATLVVDFWRDAGPALWFAKDRAFDDRFREAFLPAHEAATRGELAMWAESAEGALALLILLDQFPRNAFRGTARMYATHGHAKLVADRAIKNWHDLAIAPELAKFFYLPFAHSESLADQERAVALVRRLGEPDLARALHHLDIVRRFGRFPHRNFVLGRPTTPEEEQYLTNGGYKG